MLNENGVLEDLQRKQRPKGDAYKADSHKNYNYNLYVKHYSTYSQACQKSTYQVDDFVKLVKLSNTIHEGFLAIMILQIILGSLNVVWALLLI